jgi:hypothetical protein
LAVLKKESPLVAPKLLEQLALEGRDAESKDGKHLAAVVIDEKSWLQRYIDDRAYLRKLFRDVRLDIEVFRQVGLGLITNRTPYHTTKSRRSFTREQIFDDLNEHLSTSSSVFCYYVLFLQCLILETRQ